MEKKKNITRLPYSLPRKICDNKATDERESCKAPRNKSFALLTYEENISYNVFGNKFFLERVFVQFYFYFSFFSISKY